MARAQISKLCDIRMVPLCNSFMHCLQILSNQSYYTLRWLDHCTHAWCGFEIGHAFLHNPSLFCACIKRLHGDQLSSAYLLIFLTDPWRRHHCNAGWTWQDSAVLEGFIWQGVSWPHTHYHQTSSPILPPNQEPLSQEMRRGWLLILSLSPEPLRQEPQIRKWQLISVN